MADEVPSSRFRRLFALGRLGRQAIPMAWRRLRATPSGAAAEPDTSNTVSEPLSADELAPRRSPPAPRPPAPATASAAALETVARLAERARARCQEALPPDVRGL